MPLCGWGARPAGAEAEARLVTAEGRRAARHLGARRPGPAAAGTRAAPRAQRAASPRWERWLGPAAAERSLGDGGAAATRPEAPRAGKPGGPGTRRSPGTAGTPPRPPGELPLRIPPHTVARASPRTASPLLAREPPTGASRAALRAPRRVPSTRLPRSGSAARGAPQYARLLRSGLSRPGARAAAARPPSARPWPLPLQCSASRAPLSATCDPMLPPAGRLHPWPDVPAPQARVATRHRSILHLSPLHPPQLHSLLGSLEFGFLLTPHLTS